MGYLRGHIRDGHNHVSEKAMNDRVELTMEEAQALDAARAVLLDVHRRLEEANGGRPMRVSLRAERIMDFSDEKQGRIDSIYRREAVWCIADEGRWLHEQKGRSLQEAIHSFTADPPAAKARRQLEYHKAEARRLKREMKELAGK